MSSNRDSALSKLVGHTPLAEERKEKEISTDQKTLSGGLMQHGTTAVASALPTGYQSPPSTSVNTKPKGNICPRCEKPVYFAEEVKAAGQSFHKLCYRCSNCKKSLSGANFSEHEGNIYDNTCYQRLFGPKGVGFGIGAGTLSTGN